MDAMIYNIPNQHSLQQMRVPNTTLENAERLAKVWIDGVKRGCVPATIVIIMDDKVERVIEITDVKPKPRIAPGMGRTIARARRR